MMNQANRVAVYQSVLVAAVGCGSEPDPVQAPSPQPSADVAVAEGIGGDMNASPEEPGASGTEPTTRGGAGGLDTRGDGAAGAEVASGGAAAEQAVGGSGGSTEPDECVGDPAPQTHDVMLSEYDGHLYELSANGEVRWDYDIQGGLSIMFQVLPNGNVFYPYAGGAQEVNRDKQVVWEYESDSFQVLGGMRLANGNTLLGEQGPPVALELGPDNQIVSMISLKSEAQQHRQVRGIQKLVNGNVLLAQEEENLVREYDPAGNVVWEFTDVDHAHSAQRLPNGNTLIGGGKSLKVLEVDPDKNIVWEFGPEDAPDDFALTWITSVQVLPNCNRLITNWVGANGGPGVHAFEVTPDQEKTVVWQLDQHAAFQSATTVIALN